MSETDTGNAMVTPPMGQFVRSENGLIAWRAEFTSITIESDPNGGCIVTVRDRGVKIDLSMGCGEATQLAELLLARVGKCS